MEWRGKVKVERRTLFIALSFWALLATRNSVGVGQTSLLVMVLMLLTLLTAKKHWMIAGLALGVALSKYSLALPILLFLLFKRKYRAAALSLAVQAAGVLLLTVLTGASPVQVLAEYVQMLSLHANYPGIHLASLLPPASPLGVPLALGFSVLVLGLAGFWAAFRYPNLSLADKDLGEMHILTCLVLWTLLVAYHREYDTFLFIFFICLVTYGLSRWRLSERVKNGLSVLLIFFVLWMSRPGAVTLSFLPAVLAQQWVQVSANFATLILILISGITIALMYALSASSRSGDRGTLSIHKTGQTQP